ncbi:MAG: hypothetical protein HYZ90_05995 [Candidatus Omnitrophica bacterium]|nr:hypothetical protein [Candidatus Omnitrophota bacterium]
MRSFFRECADLWRFFVGLGKDQRRIVFYSENKNYFPYLDGILREILKNPSRTVCYLTSDPADPLFSKAPDRLKVFFSKRLLPFAVLFLDAKVLVMTMPDLHQYEIRRSVQGACHVYVFHAMVSTHMMYRWGSFDHYDVVFCVGPHHLAELRRSEELYRTPKKRLLEVGYSPLDRLIGARPPSLVQESRRVLIAPSWGDQNILESCAAEVVRSLREAGFTVLIRPHPEWVKRRPEKLAPLRQAWSGDSGVEWDLGPLRDQTLWGAEALVTDWSGFALEYAFGTERPVLFMDVPRKVKNPRYEELGMTPLEVRLRDRIGKVIPLDRSAQIGGEVQTLLKDPEGYRARIIEERSKSVFHLGRSAQVAAQFLLELSEGI